MWMTLVFILAAVSAAPQQRRRPATQVPILADDRIHPDERGNYAFRYATGDGSYHVQQGAAFNDGVNRVRGSYSYTSPEGKLVQVSYIADENGFRIVKDNKLQPVPSPLPE
ncbi:endocuticle structural glycoprotein SgAbd-2 isoform X2 [Hyalella azteca]|nr:endocuticle structural glycoprotein SgAbd-2 isoform X2 [Hyalella azteca]